MHQSTSAIDEKCCKPCYEDGEHVQAKAYCTSCKKGLCATCVIAHRKQMRSHRIFDKIYDEESYEQCNEMEVPGKKLRSTESAINENANLLINSDGSAIESNMDLLTEQETNEELLASEIEIGTRKEKQASCITKERVGIVGIVLIGIIVQVVVINKGDYTPIDLTSLRYTRAPDIQVNGLTREILLLPENRLLIADWGKKTSIIEMLDLRNNNLMFEVSLPSRPRSMCILPEERLAVSLPGRERIQFLNTLGQLSLDGNIKVDGECLGIGYHNDRLIVSYRDGKVEVMDMTGKVIKMIDKDDSGQPMFQIPLYLNVVSEAQTAVIYVSDFDKSTITKLDMDLKTLQTFQDPALTNPLGITAVGNQLLICGHDSNNIMVLDLSSGKMTQLLGEVEGIVRPFSVCYIHKQNEMYVTLATKSPIIVYKVDQTLN